MRASIPSAMLGAYACQHAFIWQSRQSSERLCLERNGTKGERATAWENTPLASTSTNYRMHWKHCSDACLHAYCPTLRLMRVNTPSAMFGAYACLHAFIWQSRQASERVVGEELDEGGARCSMCLFHSPQSQAINEVTGNTVRMRACTHTVLHYARCVPALPILPLNLALSLPQTERKIQRKN